MIELTPRQAQVQRMLRAEEIKAKVRPPQRARWPVGTPCQLREEISHGFKLLGGVDAVVLISDDGAGFVRVRIESGPWTGDVFRVAERDLQTR